MLAAAVAFAGGLFWNGKATIDDSFVSAAEARIGRPLTPMSYAGVARRTTRRAVAVVRWSAGRLAAGAYCAPAAYYAPTCVQVVDVYGRVVTHC